MRTPPCALEFFKRMTGIAYYCRVSDGKHMLIDGGRSGSFTKHAAKVAFCV